MTSTPALHLRQSRIIKFLSAVVCWIGRAANESPSTGQASTSINKKSARSMVKKVETEEVVGSQCCCLLQDQLYEKKPVRREKMERRGDSGSLPLSRSSIKMKCSSQQCVQTNHQFKLIACRSFACIFAIHQSCLARPFPILPRPLVVIELLVQLPALTRIQAIPNLISLLHQNWDSVSIKSEKSKGRSKNSHPANRLVSMQRERTGLAAMEALKEYRSSSYLSGQ